MTLRSIFTHVSTTWREKATRKVRVASSNTYLGWKHAQPCYFRQGVEPPFRVLSKHGYCWNGIFEAE